MGDAAWDALIVGSGPNGLAAAITLAREGLKVLVVEARETVGGGMRSKELTRPGFVHDVCSAVHPLAVASPFMASVPLKEYGLELIHPTVPLAHPLDGRPPAVLDRSVDRTADGLGDAADATAYRRLFGPLTADAPKLYADLLGPLRPPKHMAAALRFGLVAIRSARGLAESRFRGERAKALIAGIGAHAILPLEWRPTAAIALMLGIAGHAVGWPVAKGGSGSIAEALAAYLKSLGGSIETSRLVQSLDELPTSRAVLLDVTPRQVVAMAGDRLPSGYLETLNRYRYGPGAFKLDWALDGPIPWRDEACHGAGTVHLGGALDEVAAGEAAVWRGEHPERPFVLLSQPSLFDPTRAPAGQHTAWAYCHVPNGSTVDMTDRIEAQVERFAPGFRDRILARSVLTPADFERYNPNDIGGDINGGVQDFRQFFARPVARWTPYATPNRSLFICSSSTPPGGGVHGMCGHHAARAALRRVFGHRGVG